MFFYVLFFLDHVKFRINNFLFSNVGDNYQITKSLESFANGGVLGQGLGNGSFSKKLPDAHSDFIFALIGEEFGFIISFDYFNIFIYLLQGFSTIQKRPKIFLYLIHYLG